MKIKKEPLLKALLAVAPLTGKRTTLPILNSFLMLSSGGHMCVRASDGECDAVEICDLDCDVLPNSICVPASKLIAVLRSGGDEMEISLKENRLLLDSGARAEISVLDGKEFPPPEESAMTAIGLNAADLSRAIRSVAWAADPANVGRVEVTWLNVYVKGNKITAEGTDGKKVARCEIAAIAADCQFLLPARFVDGVCGALERDGAQLMLSGAKILVKHAAGTFSAPLGNGRALACGSVLDKMTMKVGAVEVKPLLDAIMMAQSLADDPSFARVEIAFGKESVGLKLVKGGSNYETVVPGSGIEKSFWFDSKVLMPVLKNLSGSVNVATSEDEPHGMVGFSAGDNFFVASVIRKE